MGNAYLCALFGNMTAARSVCLLCRSLLLREQKSLVCLPPPPALAHTTQEILQLSKLVRSANGDKRPGENGGRDAASTQTDRPQLVSSRLSKQALQLLPPCRFPGEIVNIKHSETEEKFADAIRRLLRNRVLGFDVECSPTNNRPILVQLASRELCVLWQVSRGAPFPLTLHGILSSPHYLKVGHGSLGDARALLGNYAVNTVNVFDTHEFLNSLPDHLRPPLLNLQGLVGVFLGRWLSKMMSRSNWSQRRLSWKQLLYASTDVWASLEVYLALMKYSGDIEVIPPSSVECTLRICRPQLMESLEKALRENIVRAEQARLAVEGLVSGATELAKVEQLNSISDPECALNTRS